MSLRDAASGYCADGLQLLKASEVARVLAIGRTKVYEMLAAGLLPVTRIGTAVRVPCKRLLEWIDEHTQTAE